MKTIIIDDEQEMEKIIRSCPVCFIAVSDTNCTPYVLPMNFGYKDKIIYLHSAPNGKIIDILNHNNKISIAFTHGQQLAYQNVEVACSYRMRSKSVIIEGVVEFIERDDEKIKALDIIMAQYTERAFTYSTPAVRNVKIWKVGINNFTCKLFGVKQNHTNF
jgi:nitroimidazol reductase NimA-like FMN-containing flavoprotein (pyridoxamine 5'-phosphate oxidase superfamily)